MEPSGSPRSIEPAYGSEHRPAALEICTRCMELRGPFRRYDNLCRCDAESWQPAEPPKAGDLRNNVILCSCCLVQLVHGSSRWSPFYCDDCIDWVRDLKLQTPGCLVPLGRHSLMNGVGLDTAGVRPTESQFVAFADQLVGFFATVRALEEMTKQRLRKRIADLGLHTDTVRTIEYQTRCTEHGWTRELGLEEFARIVT